MPREINPADTTRAMAYELWMKAPNPMVTFFKRMDITNLIRISKRHGFKFHMLLCYCIGKAASQVKEFYLLPVGEKLMRYHRSEYHCKKQGRGGQLLRYSFL